VSGRYFPDKRTTAYRPYIHEIGVCTTLPLPPLKERQMREGRQYAIRYNVL